MTFEEILDHAIAMLQRRGRPTHAPRGSSSSTSGSRRTAEPSRANARRWMRTVASRLDGAEAPPPDSSPVSSQNASLAPAVSRREDPDLQKHPSQASAGHGALADPDSTGPHPWPDP
jgi:hypothetical protein